MLAVAIAVEVTATLSLRASDGFRRPLFVVIVIAGYGFSFFLLAKILKDVPIGVVYAIWSGVGVALVTIAGRLIWGDRLPVAAIGGIALIVAGVVAIQASGAGGG
jgi:small multidrug resistance pump